MVLTLLCSILLHLSFLWLLPDLKSHAGLNGQESSRELQVTLVRARQVLPVITENKVEEISLQEDKTQKSDFDQKKVLPETLKTPVFARSHVSLQKRDIPSRVLHERKPEASKVLSQQVPVVNTDALIKSWQFELQRRINHHRRYPKQALRKGLEGDVRIKATIRRDGSLVTASVLSGHQSFKVSSLKALERSLPLPLPSGEKEEVSIVFTIQYRLY